MNPQRMEAGRRKAERLAKVMFRPSEDEARRLFVRHQWQHRKACSCPMCGNIRRNHKGEDKLTLQERKLWPVAKELEL